MTNKNYEIKATKGNTNMDFYPLRNGQMIPCYVSKGKGWFKSAWATFDAVMMIVGFIFEAVFLVLMIVMVVMGI